jgi:hypothetical protein
MYEQSLQCSFEYIDCVDSCPSFPAESYLEEFEDIVEGTDSEIMADPAKCFAHCKNIYDLCTRLKHKSS